MKKITLHLLLITIILLFKNSSIYAEEDSCTIDSSPPEILLTYIKDSIKITNNINSLVKKGEKASKPGRIGSEILRGYNSIISHSNYINEFQFFLIEPIFNEIPYQIMRDDKILANEIKRLDRIHYNLAKRGYYYKNLKNSDICKGVSNEKRCKCDKDDKGGCKLSGNAGNIIIELIDNTRKIRSLIQNASMNKRDIIDLIIVDGNFPGIIYNAYSKAKEKCSLKDKEGEEKGFYAKVNEKITNIGFNTTNAKKGMNAWKEAFNLMVGQDKNSLETYEETEKKLLKKELAKQGVNGSQTEAILGNLEKFNKGSGYAGGNDPISNSFIGIYNSVKENLDPFIYSISENFSGDKNVTSIADIQSKKTIKKEKEDLRKQIEIKYKQKLPLTASQDLITDKISTQLINMHTNILISINILNETRQLSEIVCKSQGTNLGGICDSK